MARFILPAFGLVAFCTTSTVEAYLLTNGGFENTPTDDGSQTVQALLPNDWLPANLTSDTFTTDASYGVTPPDFGRFTYMSPAGTVLPPDGNNWMGGAAFKNIAPESFAQLLTNPLTAGATYNVSAYIAQDNHANFDSPGGYDVLLSDTQSLNSGTTVNVATLGAQFSAGRWDLFTDSFVAPANAAALSYLILRPFTDTTTVDSYVGIDDVNLSLSTSGVVPEPYSAAVWLLIGLTCAGGTWWKRKRAA